MIDNEVFFLKKEKREYKENWQNKYNNVFFAVLRNHISGQLLAYLITPENLLSHRTLIFYNNKCPENTILCL